MTIDARLMAGEVMVRHAGAMARKILASPSMRLDSKGPGDVVTEADLAIEDMVRREIAVRFPGDTVFGEEGGGAASEAGFTWLIDPVDGTVNYTRRLGYYCISLALLHDRRPVAAWVFDPVQDELFHAGPDQVMRVDGRPTRASCQADLREGVVALGFSNRHAPSLGAAVVDAVLASGAEFRRLGAGALCLAHVAAGRLEGYLEPHMNPWDAVGGLYLAHCAGAVTGAYLEQGGLVGGAPVIALAPGFADALLALLPEPYSGTPLHRENDLRSAGKSATEIATPHINVETRQ